MSLKSFYGGWGPNDRVDYRTKAKRDSEGWTDIHRALVAGPRASSYEVVRFRPVAGTLFVEEAEYVDGAEAATVNRVHISEDAFDRMAKALGYTKGGA